MDRIRSVSRPWVTYTYLPSPSYFSHSYSSFSLSTSLSNICTSVPFGMICTHTTGRTIVHWTSTVNTSGYIGTPLYGVRHNHHRNHEPLVLFFSQTKYSWWRPFKTLTHFLGWSIYRTREPCQPKWDDQYHFTPTLWIKHKMVTLFTQVFICFGFQSSWTLRGHLRTPSSHLVPKSWSRWVPLVNPSKFSVYGIRVNVSRFKQTRRTQAR